jgi:hypothetical protein
MARNSFCLPRLSIVFLAVFMVSSLLLSAQTSINCYPVSSDYWTGSTTATSKTETSLIYALGGGSRGWMKFDVSAIPDGATITGVQVNYYIMGASWPYYRFTKLNADPVTTAAPNLFAVIGQATTNTGPNTYYSYESAEQTQQVSATLNNFAVADLQAALLQNWFAIGVYEYDPSMYYLQIGGWNVSVRPYLTVTYTAPLLNDIGIHAITSPLYQVSPGSYPIQILLKNYGTNMISSAVINWSLNGVPMPQIGFNDTISAGQIRLVTLAPNTFFGQGIHTIMASVGLPNNVQDPNTSNNSKTLSVHSVIPPIAFDIDTAAACPGDTVIFPVMTWNFDHISDFSLRLNYNSNSLQYLGYENLYPAIQNFSIVPTIGSHTYLTISANSATPMNVPPDTHFVNLKFIWMGGNGLLNWDSLPGNCVVHDSVNTVVPMYLYDGQVYNYGPSIYTQPVPNIFVAAGNNASIYIGATTYSAIYYQWQISTSGGAVWTNLSNNTTFTGVNSYMLGIHNVQSNYNGLKFRCVVSGICAPVTSNTTTLQLTYPPVYCLLDSISSCSISNIDVPVKVHNFSNVTSFSLKILYNSANLSYLNFTGLNPNLPAPGNFSVISSGDTLKLTWNWTIVAGFDTGVIVHLHFAALNPGNSTSLSWINTNTVHSVFYGLNGNAMTAYFHNGWVDPQQPPAAPSGISGPVNVCPGTTSVTYAIPTLANAYSYLWTLPAGVSQSSSGNSHYVILSFSTAFAGGIIQVKGINNCGYGQAASLFVGNCNTVPDTIECVLPEVNVCQGVIHYPVIINNADGLASISLGIVFNPLHLTYETYSNPFPGLSSGFLAVNDNNNNIQIGWFSVSPVNMNLDTLLCLDFIADTGWSALYFNTQTPGACYLTDINSVELPAEYFSGSVHVNGCSILSGSITYDNTLSSPISNTLIHLDASSLSAITCVSGSNGNYTMPGVATGQYQLGASITKPSGGINATDALKVLNHFVNTNPLTGMKLLAADVDGTGFINSSDGLMIVKRFVGLITTFPVGNWFVPEQALSVTGMPNITANLKALCYGDLDGSFTPAIKQSPDIDLSGTNDIITVNNNNFTLPLVSRQDAVIGAVSLILKTGNSDFKVQSIHCDFDGNLVFNQINDEIRIAWYSLNPMHINAGDVMFSLNIAYNGNPRLSEISTMKISAEGESSVAAPDAGLISSFGIQYPSLFESPNQAIAVSPNPVSGLCQLGFVVDNSSQFCISLFNNQGQKMMEVSEAGISEGFTARTIDLSTFAPGMYMMVLRSGKLYENVKIFRK